MDCLWSAAERQSIELVGPEGTLEDTLSCGNSDMLIRALVNVLGNAIKYSPPHTTITLRLADAGAEGIALHVVDQGIGIAESDLPRLFDPFFQAAEHDGAKAGVGLGLSFVKAVIERHGGSIRVTSEVGRGTDFGIVLPRA
ncbi:sensor histidine kinase [Dyella subtropica]|uniref:sensor histidine kinase n=1 Tax=Dyella subtropica TaxID=2992127 RepID=UPI00224FCFEF|nr:ATP-binding protein [Dyella subtropica]